MYFYMKYTFFQGTSVSYILFYLFEHYHLWMMDSEAQRVLFEKTPKLCVWHTEASTFYNFKLDTSFSTVRPKMGSAG